MRLRKWTLTAVALTMLIPFMRTPGDAEAAPASPAITLVMDGRTLKSDVAPYIKPKANVTMVPARVISENMGATVGWQQSSRTATVSGDGTVIKLTAGKQTAEVNGAAVKLEATVEIKNGRVMIPLRFVGEGLGLDVGWNQTSHTVTLTSKAGTGGGSGTDAGNGPGTDNGNGTGGGSGTDAGNGTGSGGGAGTGNGTGSGTNPGSGNGSGTGAAAQAVAERTVVRGAWISTVYNLDWPSKASYGDAAKQQAEYSKQLDDLQAIGINTVYVQVRPAGDALYPSSLVPWSQFLTGKQGGDPGYDPLAYMIEETHRRGMKFEAWFNPFRAATGTTTDGLAANHVALQHPEWVVRAGSVTYLNPGIPDARQHIIDAILEVVTGYDVDGIHLDDYFYPSNTAFDDDAAFKQFNAGGFKAKADWRRDNINQFVRQLGASIHAAKPNLPFGISPFGVWRNSSSDPTGSNTKAGVTSYDSMYADVRTWIKQGWIDYVAPQIYWSLSYSGARYDVLTDWWANEVKGTNVKLYIGHSPYKLGTTEAGWQSPQEIVAQLQYNSHVEQVTGDIYFSAKDMLKNPLGLIPVLRSYYGA